MRQVLEGECWRERYNQQYYTHASKNSKERYPMKACERLEQIWGRARARKDVSALSARTSSAGIPK